MLSERSVQNNCATRQTDTEQMGEMNFCTQYLKLHSYILSQNKCTAINGLNYIDGGVKIMILFTLAHLPLMVLEK